MQHRISRRRFLGRTLGVLGFAATAPRWPPSAALIAGAAAHQPLSSDDQEILVFVLGLQRLKNGLYTQALTAHEVRPYLMTDLLALARLMTDEEAKPARVLEGMQTKGSAPAATREYRLPSNAFASPIALAWFGATLEEVGIGAFLGYGGDIQNANLRRALASRHEAAIQRAAQLRTQAGLGASPHTQDIALSLEHATARLAPYWV